MPAVGARWYRLPVVLLSSGPTSCEGPPAGAALRRSVIPDPYLAAHDACTGIRRVEDETMNAPATQHTPAELAAYANLMEEQIRIEQRDESRAARRDRQRRGVLGISVTVRDGGPNGPLEYASTGEIQARSTAPQTPPSATPRRTNPRARGAGRPGARSGNRSSTGRDGPSGDDGSGPPSAGREASGDDEDPGDADGGLTPAAVIEALRRAGLTAEDRHDHHGGRWAAPCPSCGGALDIHRPATRATARLTCTGCNDYLPVLRALLEPRGRTLQLALAAAGGQA